MEKLIVGLGNPGKKYVSTKHNIGMSVIGRLPFYSKLSWKEKFKGLYASYNLNDDKFFFLMPMTYMNLSGESILALSKFFKIGVDEILLIHDELDISFGKMAFKRGGGLAGHNGLKSTANCLGSQEFMRLRMGIGRPVHGDVSSWVLSGFGKDELLSIDGLLDSAADAVYSYMCDGFDKAASIYNKKSFI